MNKELKKYLAEALGTAVLVLFGCGTAVVTGGNLIATSLAFGLAIVAMAYAIGDISGCHVNPAVSLAMAIRGKLTAKEFFGYVISQTIGALAGSGLLYLIRQVLYFINNILNKFCCIVRDLCPCGFDA